MHRTLVYKSSRFGSSDVGTVVPVAVENDDGSIIAVDPQEYPNNNKIFISKDYSKIDEQYRERELFFLRTVTLSDHFETDDINNPTKSKYYSMGFYAGAIDTNTFLPIVPMSMPDIASGRVEQGYFSDIPNNHFFILTEGVVSGPFMAQEEEDAWQIIPTNTTSPLGLASYHIAQFKFTDLEQEGLILRCWLGGTEKLFFTSLKKASDSLQFESKDYISNSALIRLFAKNDYGSAIGNLTKNEANKLVKIIEEYSKKNKVTSESERNRRIKSILGDYLKFEGIGADAIQAYFNTKPGKSFLEEFANQNRESLLKDTISAIEKDNIILTDRLNRELAEVQTRLESKKDEFRQFEIEIRNRKTAIQNDLTDLIAKNNDLEQSSLRDRNTTIMAEIEENDKQLANLKKELGEYAGLHEVRKEKEKMDVAVEYLRDQRHKINSMIETQQGLIKNPQVSDKLVEFKTLQMLLNGISPESSDTQTKPIILPKYNYSVIGETRRSYIESLKNNFDQSLGRPYSFDETANLLLCTLQSYLTILAGPPGTGKTSSAIRLSEALGLISKEKNAMQTDNFLSIPIGRGWVSTRDMLGFYNSLKNTYQPSRSGLYQFIKAFSENAHQSENDFLKLVMMDEANLSSIEHYWSDFLLMCDNFEENQKIDLGITGKDRFLNIPGSLRFIGTINNDETVEGLSNRLINRAAIISLGYGEQTSPNEIRSEILTGAVPYSELMSAFSPKVDDAELDDRETTQLNLMLDLLATNDIKGAQIHFSQRKINAIKKYCFIANQLGFEKIEPLDFAISQHLLPAISGHGLGFRDRLQRLEEHLNKMKYSVSRKILLNIIQTGDDFSDSYSFF